MKKRLLALLLAIVIIVGLVVVAIPASAASTNKTYDVGYAKADISPWIKDYPGTTNMIDDAGNAIGIPYSDSWGTDYIATNNLVVNTKTGIAVPVATLNAPVGYSSQYFTTVTDVNGDGMNGQGDGIYTTATSVTDKQGNTVLFLTLDAIAGYSVEQKIKSEIVNGVYKATGITLNPDCIYLNGSHTHRGIDPSKIYSSSVAPLKAYWNYYKQQIIDAAVAAYENRTPATMSKGQIDASDASGLQMNFIRHYNTVKMAEDVNGDSVTVIGGPNFGAIGQNATKLSNLYEADDMMYLLQFTPVDTEQKPIVLMNWRAHGTLMTTSSVLSPDYIGSVRSYMEKAGYRIAFLQGAAGNAVPDSTVTNATKWKVKNNWNTELRSGFTYTNTDEKTLYLNYYGYLLSRIAQKCVMSELKEGTIRTSSSTYTPDKNKATAIQIEGAIYWHNELGSPSNIFPWTYTGSNGNSCVFDSSNQISNIYNRNSTADKQKETKAASMTVNAIMLGNQVAMVTCGNELSDRYTKTDTLQYNTTTKQWYISGTDNDWKDLVDDTYGTPFVLAYTNGTHAYMPNYLSYQYNADVPTCGGGCYESQTTPYAPGTGEALIGQFKTMLTGLANEAVADAAAVLSDGYYYDTLAEAVEEVSENALLKLVDNVSLDGNLVIDKDLYLDLNGKTITFGQYKINVEGDYKLYCMDSQTADFTVEDGNGYAKIPANSVVGNVVGVPEGTNRIEEGLQYMKVVENNQISFHCVKLDTYAITLQAKDGNSEDPGVYYTSDFAGDEVVQSKVESYGVALSLVEAPSASNIDTLCQKSTYTGLNSGSSTGTLLYNILNPNNAELVNRVNANTNVFGKAYIKLKDDAGYLFGNLADYSLKDVVESINNSWDRYETTQKDNVVNMLFNYSSIVKSWDTSNIRTHKTDDKSLNILVIGNSHGLDSTRMLYEVFQKEGMPEGTDRLVIANLYYGGCTMQQHADFLTNNKVEYEYHKVSTESGGKWSQQKNATGLTAMQDEQWDIVILQQANRRSGVTAEFNKNHLDAVMNYVKANQFSIPEFAWNMLWANPDYYAKFLDYNETELSFAPLSIGRMTSSTPTAASVNEVKKFRAYLETHFSTDGVYYQENLYNAITANVSKYTDHIGTTKVNPAGTAIMKAMQILEGEKGYSDMDAQLCLFRDYTHLSHYGRLIAAYTLYGTLTGKTEFKAEEIITELPKHLNVNDDGHNSTYNWSNSYPELENNKYTFTAQDIEVLTEAVNWALTHPYTVEN